MKRQSKVLLFTLGTLHNLKEKELVTGPDYLTPEGIKEYEQLKTCGFQPSKEELAKCLNYLQTRKPNNG